MAKRIQLSDDAGVTWNTLPGSGGSFNAEGEQIDDTILGQTFQSNITGLLNWGISSDGVFKGFPGYLAKIKESGTPTAMSGEAMEVESGLIYVVSDPTREIWDRSAGVVVNDDGTPVDPDDIEWIDYLFGRVKFVTGYTPTGAITVDGNYVPTAALGKGQTYTMLRERRSGSGGHRP